MVRCWELLHRPAVRRWAKQQEREWDAAVAGNSCLREAMRGVICDECCDALKLFHGNLLADIE
eukprot:986048-Pyramimonas_sp.AAC.1